jgi:hypothetical protein
LILACHLHAARPERRILGEATLDAEQVAIIRGDQDGALYEQHVAPSRTYLHASIFLPGEELVVRRCQRRSGGRSIRQRTGFRLEDRNQRAVANDPGSFLRQDVVAKAGNLIQRRPDVEARFLPETLVSGPHVSRRAVLRKGHSLPVWEETLHHIRFPAAVRRW